MIQACCRYSYRQLQAQSSCCEFNQSPNRFYKGINHVGCSTCLFDVGHFNFVGNGIILLNQRCRECCGVGGTEVECVVFSGEATGSKTKSVLELFAGFLSQVSHIFDPLT